jgi:hypothetical protein
MDHRAHVAGPPPLRQPVPVITAAPSVEGSGAKLGCYSKLVKDYFQKQCVDKARPREIKTKVARPQRPRGCTVDW